MTITSSGVPRKRLFNYDFVYGGTGQAASTLKIEPSASGPYGKTQLSKAKKSCILKTIE
jgi:hypothetical protein